MREVQVGLQRVFCTQRPVFISTSSATGLMEAAVRNAGRTKILSLTNGAFSERFQKRPEAAKKLMESGDSKPNPDIEMAQLAAWTMAANALMNRDDFINKN